MKKALSIILIFLISVLCASCNSKTSEVNEKTIHFIPQSINSGTYGSKVNLQIGFVSNYELDSIKNLDLEFEYDDNSSINSYKYTKLYLLEEYKGHYIYRIDIDLTNIKGGVKVTHLSFNDSKDNYYEEELDIFYTSEYDEINHFYSGNGSFSFVLPGFRTLGINEIISSNNDLTLRDFYFNTRTSFDLSNYIDEVKINKKIFNGNLDIVKDELLSLNLTFKDETPDDMVLINQLMVHCIDSDNNKVPATILASIILGDFTITGKVYIDQL